MNETASCDGDLARRATAGRGSADGVLRRATQKHSQERDDARRDPRALVRRTCLDTSAAMKLIPDEPRSEALTAELAGREDRQLISSWLLHTEMHCAAGGHPAQIDLEAVRTVLDAVSLIGITCGDLLAAGAHAPLRSNDAIHLAVAIRVAADEIATYDGELVGRATAVGLPILAPGAGAPTWVYTAVSNAISASTILAS